MQATLIGLRSAKRRDEENNYSSLPRSFSQQQSNREQPLNFPPSTNQEHGRRQNSPESIRDNMNSLSSRGFIPKESKNGESLPSNSLTTPVQSYCENKKEATLDEKNLRRGRRQRRPFGGISEGLVIDESYLHDDFPALHGIVDSDLEGSFEHLNNNQTKLDHVKLGTLRSQKSYKTLPNATDHAFIHYFATLAKSNADCDNVDFDFIDHLLKYGADINITDKFGQTVFHELARSWDTDVATFFQSRGADINKVDKFGRAPLHVAAAANYPEMVEYLIRNGADVHAQTRGELQTPLHYAAKNDAGQSIKTLLSCGADINSLDFKKRTPLHVASELNRSEAAKVLVEEGAQAGLEDESGMSALVLLILKIPSVAQKALYQFHVQDRPGRKQYFYLNYLERSLRAVNNKSPAQSTLQAITESRNMELIVHPVVRRLIAVKWDYLGKYGTWREIITYLIFLLVWSVLIVLRPQNIQDNYLPLSRKWWRVLLEILMILLAIREVGNGMLRYYRERKRRIKWRKWREEELKNDLEYCHPKWPEEKKLLDNEIKIVGKNNQHSYRDKWVYFDWISYFMVVSSITAHIVDVAAQTEVSGYICLRILSLTLIVIWARLLKFVRPFESLGPFILMMGHMLGDTIRWGFLFFVFYIPYVIVFWVIFGGRQTHPVTGYGTVGDILFTVFRLSATTDIYNFNDLSAVDHWMSRLLYGTFLAICCIVLLNLFIALMSDTFVRVYENAIANTDMLRATTILDIENSMPKAKREKYYQFIHSKCSPEKLYFDEHLEEPPSQKDILKKIDEQTLKVQTIIQERIGDKRFGEKTKSDFDILQEGFIDLQSTFENQQKMITSMNDKINEINGIIKVLERLVTNKQKRGSKEMKEKSPTGTIKRKRSNNEEEVRSRDTSRERDLISRLGTTRLSGSQSSRRTDRSPSVRNGDVQNTSLSSIHDDSSRESLA